MTNIKGGRKIESTANHLTVLLADRAASTDIDILYSPVIKSPIRHKIALFLEIELAKAQETQL